MSDPEDLLFVFVLEAYNCRNSFAQRWRMLFSKFSENVCELRTKTFSCPFGSKIWIDNGMYGRLTKTICSYGSLRNMSCSSDVTNIVREKCQNNMICKLQATNEIYGDPCSGTFKYLQIHYRCTKRSKWIICWYCRTSLLHEKAKTYRKVSRNLAASGIYFGSPFGRYPTFHTLTSVGRKIGLSMGKGWFRFFVYWIKMLGQAD